MGNRTEQPNPSVARYFDAAIVLVLWALLLWIQNPGLMADDSGEMAAAAVGLGIPHPPGYPLLTLLGHLATWLPLGTPAFRMNLLSLAFLLTSVLAGFRLLDRLRVKRSGTGTWGMDRFLFILFLFSIHSLVAQALTAKGAVYTLTLLLGCLLIVICSSKLGPVRQGWVLAFVWSVGLTHHWQTMVLWLPLVVWKWFASGGYRNPRILLNGVTFGFLGFSVYLFLPLRAIQDCVPSWGYPIHPSLFYWVLSRQLVSHVEHWLQPPGFYRETALEMGRFFLWGTAPPLVPLAVMGAWRWFREQREWFWSALGWGGPVVIGVFLIHETQNIYLLPVYLVSIGVVMALLAWSGLKVIVDDHRFRSWGRPVIAGVLLFFLFWDVKVWSSEDKSRYLLAQDFGTNVLRDTPRGAILLAEGDPYVMSIWYSRTALGQRPDIVFEPAVFLVHGWGWKQIADQSPKIGAEAERSTLFQERFESLTEWDDQHPLCYSLGHEKMTDALRNLPGFWQHRGLVMEWVPARKTFPGSPAPYRLRIPQTLPTDQASVEISAYYGLARPPSGL